MTLATDLATRFPPTTFAFGLREEVGFDPPPGVVRLRGAEQVDISLALGAHYFFTCLAPATQEQPFGLVEHFLSQSIVRDGLHLFCGPTFDSEINRAFSAIYSKFVGIAFMSEYAGATWFSSLEQLWNCDTAWLDGPVRFEKEDCDAYGPDYVSAPFDPTADEALDPIYVLEFKGRGRVWIALGADEGEARAGLRMGALG